MNLKSIRLLMVSLMFLGSCAKMDISSTGINESGDESATEFPTGDFSQKGLQLTQDINVRYLKSNVLELKIDVPNGTKISIPDNFETVHYDYRNATGGLSRSSTGFVAQVKIVSVPAAYQTKFTQQKINELNATNGGLYISASVIGSAPVVVGERYSVVQPSTPGPGHMKFYSGNGKPKFTFTKSVTARFGARLNKAVPESSLSAAQRMKWNKIYSELKKAVDRTVATPKSYLIMEKSKAVQASIDFENKGIISPMGAWSVAVLGTATRHGFANVPCAETQSEILRQAYQRAGYSITTDFNTQKGNPLIWSNTAAVVNFSMGLYKAGWVPWDASKYKAPVGAFLMHGSGKSPGHTYIAAGNNGQTIVDNGAPQGRDLRKTSEKSIDMQYLTGVFFLPPGINPSAW